VVGTLVVCAAACGLVRAEGDAGSPRWPSPGGAVLLPGTDLFSYLLADPRQSATSATWQYEFRDDLNRSAVSFGDSFPLIRMSDLSWTGGALQLDVEGGVFATFDMESGSRDLVNADYTFAVPLTYRAGDFSSRLRWRHLSSHLGDEYLLNHDIERVNFTYEEVDVAVSREWDPWRLYAGVGYKYNVEPARYLRWDAEVGLEWRGPYFAGGLLRPVAGVHVMADAERDWEPFQRAVAGLETAAARPGGPVIRFVIEGYNGRSFEGQFYESRVRWVGIGTQVDF